MLNFASCTTLPTCRKHLAFFCEFGVVLSYRKPIQAQYTKQKLTINRFCEFCVISAEFCQGKKQICRSIGFLLLSPTIFTRVATNKTLPSKTMSIAAFGNKKTPFATERRLYKTIEVRLLLIRHSIGCAPLVRLFQRSVAKDISTVNMPSSTVKSMLPPYRSTIKLTLRMPMP